MEASENGRKLPEWPVWAIAAVGYCGAVGLLASRGTLVAPDSAGYLAASSVRPALYPLFLDLIDLATGGGAERYTHLFQIALGAAALFFATLTFRRLFGLGALATVAVSVCLLVPYFRYAPFANLILSEGLAYPLFLFATALLLSAMLTRSLPQALGFLALTIALCLVRKQFLFLFPLGLLVALHAGLQDRDLRRALIVAAATLAGLAATPFVDKGAAWLARGDAYRYPLTAVQLVTLPVYAAPLSAAERLTPESAAIFLAARRVMDERTISLESFRKRPWPHIDVAAHYARSFADALHEAILPAAISTLFAKPYRDAEDWKSVERLLTRDEVARLDAALFALWRDLGLAAPAETATVFVRNVMFFLGGPMFLVLFALLGALAARAALGGGSGLGWAVATALAAHLGNFLLVALVEPVYPRYSLYTDAVVIAMIVVLASAAFDRRRNRVEP